MRRTLRAFLIQGEGSPRRQIRACAPLQERLEKKANQGCAPVREPRIAQINLSLHWRKLEVLQQNLILADFGRQRRENGAIIYGLVPTQEQLNHTVLSSTNSNLD